MCLVTLKTCYKVLTAKENITVYKVLQFTSEENFFTPYMKYPIIFDKIMRAEGKLQLESDGNIVNVSNGMFHSYSTYFQAFSFAERRNLYIFKAIIPKGAKYILGLGFEIASNKLLIKREGLIYKNECKIKYECLQSTNSRNID